MTSDPFASPSSVHIVGVGGEGMSALARLFATSGWRVSGSDMVRNGHVESLETLGVACFRGHSPANVGSAALVVCSPAIPRVNPEIVAARAVGIPVWTRTKALTRLLAGRHVVGVAGSHGKTTTTAMLTLILEHAGMHPGFMVGGVAPVLGGINARIGEGDVFVAETCEAFRALDLWQPDHCVVTNVDDEHSNHYRDFASLQDAFGAFAARVPETGTTALGGDDPFLAALARKLGPRVVTFGLGPGNLVTARRLALDGEGSSFDIVRGADTLGRLRLNVPGLHNIRNMLGATALALSLGVELQAVIGAMETFRPVRRRWQEHAVRHGVRVIDDFAHHPTEIEATLATARLAAKSGRLHAVLEPALASRISRLAEQYAAALALADRIWLLPADLGGEQGDGAALDRRLQAELCKGRTPFTALSGRAGPVIADAVAVGDIVVCMGPAGARRAVADIVASLNDRTGIPPARDVRPRDAAPPAPPGSWFHGAFEAHAKERPDALCAVTSDETWSYGRIDAAANRIAAALVRRGIGPDDIVAVFMEKSPPFVAALLGIAKAGAAFATIDRKFARPGMGRALRRAGARLTLTDDPVPALLAGLDGPATIEDLVADVPAGAVPPPCPARPDHLAYAIFTSGSTGTPRLVGIEHRQAVAVMRQAVGPVYGLEEFRLVPTLASPSFDACVFQIYATLTAGGALLVVEDMAALIRSEQRGRISILGATPSMLRTFFEVTALPPSVKTVVVGGEPTPDDLLARLRAIPTLSRVRNVYGPAETTFFALHELLHDRQAPDRAMANDGRTIGRPLPEVAVRVVGPDDRDCDPGEAGELLVGGTGVGRGYLGDPDATSARFRGDPHDPARRWYRTGDVVRQRPDGRFLFLGRDDDQVKINGARLELGEVTDTLLRCPGVRDAHCISVEDVGGRRKLAGFVVLDDDTDKAFVRDWLRRHCAPILSPHSLQALPALPHQVNGKVDRQILREMWRAARSTGGAEDSRTRADHGEDVLSIWRHVLKRPTLDLDEDFAQAGGDSLMAMELVLAVEGHYGIRLRAQDIEGLSTPRAMIRAIQEEAPAAPAIGTPQRVPDQDEIIRRQLIYLRGWRGQRAHPNAMIHTLPLRTTPKATSPGLFWVFQAFQEFASLAMALHGAFPLHGLRSGNMIMQYTPETIALLAEAYAREIDALQPTGPLALGGNCQGGVIARATAIALRAAGRQIAHLILMEQGKLWKYDQPVELIYGRDSTLNPFASGEDVTPRYQKSYPAGFRIHLIDGSHGEFFRPDEVRSLARVLRGVFNPRDACYEAFGN